MRAIDTFNKSLCSMRRAADLVPENHAVHPVRKVVNAVLKKIEPLLSRMCAADIKGGRTSIASEELLRAVLLKIFYSIRSERLLMEQNQDNIHETAAGAGLVTMMRLSIALGRQMGYLCSAIPGDGKELSCVN